MADDLEKKLREIRNKPARSEAGNDELKTEIKKLRAKMSEQDAKINEQEKRLSRERESRPIEKIETIEPSVQIYGKRNLDTIENLISKMVRKEGGPDFEKEIPSDVTKNELYKVVEEILPRYKSLSKLEIRCFLWPMIEKVLKRDGHLSLDFSGYGEIDGFGVLIRGGCLEIKGNAEIAGRMMEGGKIILHGNSRHAGDFMTGGEVVVCGNTEWAGSSMEGGTITIKGNADYVGFRMEGGSITVHGYAEHVGGNAKGGKIFLNGEYGVLESNKFFNSLEIYQNGKRIK